MLVQCGPGLGDSWLGLEGGGFHLAQPAFLVGPGQILLADVTAGNPHAHQSLAMWRDETNPYGTRIDLVFPASGLFFYLSSAAGNELLMTVANADVQVDRPVTVSGQPPAVRTLNSLFVIALTSSARYVSLLDEHLIQDAAQLSSEDPFIPEPMALALRNALFHVTPAHGVLLFGALSADIARIESGFLFLTFGLLAYLPTLPDPYAANLGRLRRPTSARDPVTGAAGAAATGEALVSRVRWDEPAIGQTDNAVEVSFHFAPLSNQFAGVSLDDDDDDQPVATPVIGATSLGARAVRIDRVSPASVFSNDISGAIVANRLGGGTDRLATPEPIAATASAAGRDKPLPDYVRDWDEQTDRYRRNLFALLDVSTNADLYGVSFDLFSRRGQLLTTHVPVGSTNGYPIQVQGLDVVSAGRNAKVFTVPLLSWEPLINLTPPAVTGDPPWGFNYYPDDGGPMQIVNNGEDTVALAPLPLTDYLLTNFAEGPDEFAALSLLTLPFGLKALALLQNQHNFTDENGVSSSREGTEVRLNAEAFSELHGGLQLQLNAGEAYINGESRMFVGNTLQLNNVLDLAGNAQGDSTLGRTVTEIFNNEFFDQPMQQRGVPLTRIDLSGYGASTLSNWLNPAAAFAQTSQAKFDVFVGRCAHEVIQVKSIVYPWGIKVVRTITMFRVGSGYVYRFDSGWKAESDGEFDFRYFVTLNPADANKVEMASPYVVHPGIVRRLVNVENIIETDEIAVAEGQMVAAKIVNQNNQYIDNPDPQHLIDFKLQPVYFDADVEIDDAIAGFATQSIGGKQTKVVASKRIVGY
ncbi:MAG: hypothetical protein JJ992_23385, partial [Planctomycetes bacterium]|nr:hypothetical protein [Planctomycetota bacterium]